MFVCNTPQMHLLRKCTCHAPSAIGAILNSPASKDIAEFETIESIQKEIQNLKNRLMLEKLRQERTKLKAELHALEAESALRGPHNGWGVIK